MLNTNKNKIAIILAIFKTVMLIAVIIAFSSNNNLTVIHAATIVAVLIPITIGTQLLHNYINNLG